MPPTNLQEVADAIVRLAHRQGYVVSKDIRTELTRLEDLQNPYSI